MLYLIDGYNLLHALGLIKKGAPGLEKARHRFLSYLHGSLGDADARTVTVIVDAAKAPPGVNPEQEHRGLQVRFAVGESEADDLIEQLIRRASVPKDLAVVSDDHRIQQAARRRRCTVLGCAAFIDRLARLRQARPPTADEAVTKPEGSSRDEIQHWLKEFGGLDQEPEMREAFNPFPFDFDGENEQRDWRDRPIK